MELKKFLKENNLQIRTETPDIRVTNVLESYWVAIYSTPLFMKLNKQYVLSEAITGYGNTPNEALEDLINKSKGKTLYGYPKNQELTIKFPNDLLY